MDPLTAMTLGSIGISAIGGLISSSRRRREARRQAQLERERVAELQRRAEENIENMRQEGAFAQRQAQATVAASGAALGGATGLAQMNNIANAVAKEASIVRRETDYAVRAGLSQASAMERSARGGFLDTVNILAGAGIQAGQTWQMRPQSPGATPRQQRQFNNMTGEFLRPSLLTLGDD